MLRIGELAGTYLGLFFLGIGLADGHVFEPCA